MKMDEGVQFEAQAFFANQKLVGDSPIMTAPEEDGR